MDGTRQAISQPPHSTGQKYPGLRAHINADAIPSPVAVAVQDQALWDGEDYYTLASEQPLPLSSSRYVAVDQGNSAPRFMRMSAYAIPKDNDLASTCSIPLAVACQPLAEQPPRETPVPLVDFGPNGPPRCVKCAGYINSWCTWTRGGQCWACNLCGAETEVSSEYFSNLNPMTQPMRRLDHDQRPELQVGTVDFAVPKEYWSTQPVPRLEPSFASDFPATGPRPPVPLHVLFAIEVTAEAVESGFTAAACAAVRAALDDGYLSRVAILTFDREICFYNCTQEPHMLVVSDIDEVFVPLRDDLFVDPTQSRFHLDTLLTDIPSRIFAQTTARSSALLPAIRAGFAALASTGGHLITFAHSLPSLGPGVLQPRTDESGLYNSGKERELFVPRDRLYESLAEECAEGGVGVSLVLGPRRFVDVGSIGILPTLTGGEILFFPAFDAVRDAQSLVRGLRRLVGQDEGYDVSVRVRCSRGLRVSGYAGTHHQTSPSTTSLGLLNRTRMLLAVLEHASSSSLNEREMAYVQCATLYTTRGGERRVRVCNLGLPVVALAGSVFRQVDVETVVAYLARRAVARMTSKSLRDIKDELTEQACTMLLAYRKNCAASTAPSQLILPEALKTLPLYALGILKTKCLKGGSVNSDVRNFHAHLILSWGVRDLLRHLYPLLLSLHTEPTRTLRDGYMWMEPDGVYVIDNGVYTVLWIGYAVDPELLQALFGTSNVRGVTDWHREMQGLPELDNPHSVRIRGILENWTIGHLLLARQNEDAAEMAFGDMLVEDCNNDGMSYVDYLCWVHKHINAALTGETTIGQTMGFRASTPW
ncbi:hypothetical protein EXIGLDRAFT_722972 [Exidia glandulosa HHB12029]|uniref:Uncharacterized protein n=1 Tax=Exidia glandulosa HHB12029 TaxID=1314781 RepID=A0A165F0V0_EXIGL|nr:hypothetical protein EXIGLDRAFT_722972 [Exidia glandulosa HHB12029]